MEKKDRERKDKKRHINALKHPEQASIYRKTLRSARRIIEGITVDSHQKKDWQKPFSGHGTLKHQKSTGSGVGTLPLSSENPMGERKQSNPLRFVMNPMLSQSVLREQSAARASEMASSVEALDTDHRSSMQSYSTQQSEHVASDSTRSKSRDFKRKLSTASTPETLSPRDFDTSLTASYERTQSVPVESIPAVRPPELSPVYELEDEPTSKLEAIPEDNTIGEQAEEDRSLYLYIVHAYMPIPYVAACSYICVHLDSPRGFWFLIDMQCMHILMKKDKTDGAGLKSLTPYIVGTLIYMYIQCACTNHIHVHVYLYDILVTWRGQRGC